MIVAAAAAMTIGANAAVFQPIDCDEPDIEAPCPVMVFKLTASGKATVDMNEGAYKSVKALKVSKGALALFPNEECAADGLCCYDTATIYAQLKMGSDMYLFGLADVEIGKWSVFGKNFEAAKNYRSQIKPGKTVKLESDLFLTADAVDTLDGEDTVSLWASAFGDMTLKVTKATKTSGYCDNDSDEGCDPIWTPKTYNGWFVGYHNLVNDMYSCFNCDCGDYDIFGGTWKAVYQAKLASDSDAQKLAFNKKVIFGEDGLLEDEE